MPRTWIPLVVLTFFVCAGCAKPISIESAPGVDFERLRSAIAGLESLPDGRPGPQYEASLAIVSGASTPAELREVVKHFDDPRPTQLLESVERPDGKPVTYTIGNALYFFCQMKFYRGSGYRAPGNNCPNYFSHRPDFVAWLEAHNYEMSELNAAYARDMAQIETKKRR